MKQSETNYLDKHFAQVFEDFEAEPSNTVWMNVEKELDRNRKFVRNSWITRLSIAASIVLCVAFGIYFFSEDTGDMKIAKEINNNTSEKSIAKNPGKVLSNEKINNTQLADVVEIISKPSKAEKKPKTNTVQPTPNSGTPESRKQVLPVEQNKVANETERTLFNQVAQAKEELPVDTEHNERTNIQSEVPFTELATINAQQAIGVKREINTVASAVNYLSERISGDKASLIAINNEADEFGAVRKSYQIDLGFVKLTRIRNTNN